MNRMLVVGAGASVEECKRSGAMQNNPEWRFPTINNFCDKLFDRLPTPQIILTNTELKITSPTYSGALFAATANYLLNQKISFDDRFLRRQAGDTYTKEDLDKNPVAIFCELEKQNPQNHNIETLSEFTWQLWGNNPEYWNSFVHEGIYFNLFTLFTQQFGLGIGRPMKGGQGISSQLSSNDIVLNLNYDIVFDLALQQSGKSFSYSPKIQANTIAVFKPHGSFNLYTDYGKDYIDYMFVEPHRIGGTGNIENSAGKIFSPCTGILPPRLNKNYAQHPLSEYILSVGRPYHARVVTFWGVGLTPSDTDLLAIYKEATESAEVIEFINPDLEAFNNAEVLLSKKILHFPTLHDWFEKYGISD